MSAKKGNNPDDRHIDDRKVLAGLHKKSPGKPCFWKHNYGQSNDECIAILDAWQARMERERKSGTGNPIALATDANVFVEGIAFVRVARLRGLRTRGQYPLIPPIALSDAPLGLERRRIW
jgi:hypothetical protein